MTKTVSAEAFSAIAEKNGPKTILFVCTGNTCRSPMAEAVFNSYFSDGTMIAGSAGTHAADGQAISSMAKTALAEISVFKFCHVSKRINEDILSKAEKIICMESSHLYELICRFPQFAGKISLLGNGISDPYGGSIEVYRKCLKEIVSSLTEMFGDPKKEIICHE